MGDWDEVAQKQSELRQEMNTIKEKIREKEKQIDQINKLLEKFIDAKNNISKRAETLNHQYKSYQVISDHVFQTDIFEGVASEQLLKSQEETMIVIVNTATYMRNMNTWIDLQRKRLHDYITEKRNEIKELEVELSMLWSQYNCL